MPFLPLSSSDVSSSTKLSQLIESKDWAQVMSQLQRKKARQDASVTDSKSNLPIHRVCQMGGPFQVVEALVELNPDGPRTRGFGGNLPLHFACDNEHPPSKTAAVLANHFRMGASMLNDNNSSPMHLACCRRAPQEIIEDLLKACPTVASMPDGRGWLPLHLACFHRSSADVISALLHAHPKSARLPAQFGWLPLHCACFNKPTPSVVQLLLDAFVRATRMADNDGFLPLHAACHNSCDIEVLQLLIDAYPRAVHVPDKLGRAPLDHAREHQGLPKVVELLLQGKITTGTAVQKRPSSDCSPNISGAGRALVPVQRKGGTAA